MLSLDIKHHVKHIWLYATTSTHLQHSHNYYCATMTKSIFSKYATVSIIVVKIKVVHSVIRMSEKQYVSMSESQYTKAAKDPGLVKKRSPRPRHFQFS